MKDTKIIIAGVAGAGKTTLAKKLAQELSVRHIELDKLYWGENWQPSSQKDLRSKLKKELVDLEGWVIDGYYGETQGTKALMACDKIIFLDVNLTTAHVRTAVRSLKFLITRKLIWGKQRESLRSAWRLQKKLHAWHKVTQNQMRDPLISRKVLTFKSNRSANKWLKGEFAS